MRLLAVTFVVVAVFDAAWSERTDHLSAQNALDNDPRFDARVSDLLAQNVLQLAQEIGTTVLQDSDQPTEVFSPLSIYAALSMLMMGSNGQTFQELMSLLKMNNDVYLSQNSWKIHEEFGLMIEDINRDIPNPRHRRPQDYWQLNRRPLGNANFGFRRRTTISRDPRSFQLISVANGIFIQNGYSVRPDFKDAIESTYKSTLQRLDFIKHAELSTQFINRWVNEKTEGKIKEMFSSPLSSDTKIVIATALYFKALWEKTFMEGATRQKEFYPDGLDRPSILVEMMANAGAFPFYESKEFDCRIIGLPYRRNLTTMFVIQPNNSNRQRLRQLQSRLTAEKIQDMISKMEWRTAIVLFPKMHITNELNLRRVLDRMGLRTLFQNGKSDLSLMSTGEEVEANSEQNTNVLASKPSMRHNQRYPGAPDDNDDDKFLFSRFSDEEMMRPNNKSAIMLSSSRSKRSAVTYKASSEFHQVKEPLRLKDLVLGKRITKSWPRKKIVSRGRRQAIEAPLNSSLSLKRLDLMRTRGLPNPGLFADELIHRVDLTLNEVGTEGGAATATSLSRTGTDVVFRAETPFLFLIRHDDTRLPLFYGAVFEPTAN